MRSCNPIWQRLRPYVRRSTSTSRPRPSARCSPTTTSSRVGAASAGAASMGATSSAAASAVWAALVASGGSVASAAARRRRRRAATKALSHGPHVSARPRLCMPPGWLWKEARSAGWRTGAAVSTACEQRGSCGRAVTRAQAWSLWSLEPGAWSLEAEPELHLRPDRRGGARRGRGRDAGRARARGGGRLLRGGAVVRVRVGVRVGVGVGVGVGKPRVASK